MKRFKFEELLVITANTGPVPVLSVTNTPDFNDEKLRDAAKQLEASFLSEMLKSAGFGEARESFGGGVGEEQFASFLRDSHAKSMVETGGIGLAEHLFNALKSRDPQ